MNRFLFTLHPGQNPFYDESFTFYIHFPELALVRFNILDDDFIGDEFIAQYTVPFRCVRSGQLLFLLSLYVYALLPMSMPYTLCLTLYVHVLLYM